MPLSSGDKACHELPAYSCRWQKEHGRHVRSPARPHSETGVQLPNGHVNVDHNSPRYLKTYDPRIKEVILHGNYSQVYLNPAGIPVRQNFRNHHPHGQPQPVEWHRH